MSQDGGHTSWSTAHIQDAVLKEIYENLTDKPRDILGTLGPAAMTRVGDKLAVLEAMRQACVHIISDLKEHGPEQGTKVYDDDRPVEFFEGELTRIEGEISAARAGGAKSDVFARYKNPRVDTKNKAWRKARR